MVGLDPLWHSAAGCPACGHSMPPLLPLLLGIRCRCRCCCLRAAMLLRLRQLLLSSIVLLLGTRCRCGCFAALGAVFPRQLRGI